ncbi:DUF2934 domain-containing protein [Variovorax dokdonensis]|uniref:DUF2934 domain-containing protein n=1 Tax=Variovorax dokdonensis TaxID=344883 RepID=A0ABT7NDS4_9BURK|nr:DUF2934 domain-containing protein [Variovorax dokdonensis]MDM0045980.1 DUF2934 domain-containing protein [Variovorax dokdonensis]
MKTPQETPSEPRTDTASTHEDRVRRAAYELAERRGFAPGYELEDWLAAEKQVLGDSAVDETGVPTQGSGEQKGNP